MMKKMTALLLAAALMIPALALGESTALPFGLTMGMNNEQVEEAMSAQKGTPDKEEYAGATDYLYADLTIPGTELTATSVELQVDQNNSAKEDRLSSVSLTIMPAENSIATFRTLLAALTEQYGAPASDPFAEEAVEGYVEWGMLEASWAFEDVRISLSLSRMYEESVSLSYNSRLNYDKADLAE